MRRHDRCIGECKIGKCQRALFHGHLYASGIVCTSQNRLSCLGFCDHDDPHHQVTERPRQGHINCVTRVQGISNQVQYKQVLITVSRAMSAAGACKIKHSSFFLFRVKILRVSWVVWKMVVVVKQDGV